MWVFSFMKKWYGLLTLSLYAFFAAFPARLFAQTAEELGLGTIEIPAGPDIYQQRSGEEIGLIFFISAMIKVFTIVVGVYAAFNMFLASYHFFSLSGDAGGFQKAKDQFVQSTIGLLIIVLSFTLTGLVSYIFFGDPTFILSPKIQ